MANLHIIVWICTYSFGFVQICQNSDKSAQICTDLDRFVRICQNSWYIWTFWCRYDRSPDKPGRSGTDMLEFSVYVWIGQPLNVLNFCLLAEWASITEFLRSDHRVVKLRGEIFDPSSPELHKIQKKSVIFGPRGFAYFKLSRKYFSLMSTNFETFFETFSRHFLEAVFGI